MDDGELQMEIDILSESCRAMEDDSKEEKSGSDVHV